MKILPILYPKKLFIFIYKYKSYFCIFSGKNFNCNAVTQCNVILEKEGGEAMGIGFLLLDFLFHPVGCHFEEEVDEVLVGRLCADHA